MEEKRLKEGEVWRKWGPYLSERQWGTVREDQSQDGNCWEHMSHDEATHQAYRWGEDGLLGITDDQCNLCLSLALWNENDPILKERLYGLTNRQGNHGEDVKELYYYLDNTPTHSYMKALYKYPQQEFPYRKLLEENKQRTVYDREYKVLDTGIFKEKIYFDVLAEYCKASPTDILGRYTITNRGPDTAVIHVLPTLWFRNVWSWGECDAAVEWKPILRKDINGRVTCHHPSFSSSADGQQTADTKTTETGIEEAGPSEQSQSMGKRKRGSSPTPSSVSKKRKVETKSLYVFEVDKDESGDFPELLFTENESKVERILGRKKKNKSQFVKDAFHQYIINGKDDAVNTTAGTKCSAHYKYSLASGQEVVVKIRLSYQTENGPASDFSPGMFDTMFFERIQEANKFYDKTLSKTDDVYRDISRQAYAGLLWNKQFYYLVQMEWMAQRKKATWPHTIEERNKDWQLLYNKNIISMPDKWEFPWYAAWDLALQMIPFANIDAEFAMSQLELLLGDGYLHPGGQIPAFEFDFSDNNPPVHAYAVLKVFKKSLDISFLKRCFNKLCINYEWWNENLTVCGTNLFTGGFLGLDNISVFNRSKPPLKGGFFLAQADATAWMAVYSLNMLEISLLLSKNDAENKDRYDSLALRFFQRFLEISDSMNGETGLWNCVDGFYYDQIRSNDKSFIPRHLKIKSVAGFISLFGRCSIRLWELQEDCPKLYQWMTENQEKLNKSTSLERDSDPCIIHLSIVNRERLIKLLTHLLDEEKFLSPFGIRSLSKEYRQHAYCLTSDDWSSCVEFKAASDSRQMKQPYSISYEPAESRSSLFGGNSNWRGPIWLPVNFLLIEHLKLYGSKDSETRVEFPTGSGQYLNIGDVSIELSKRVIKMFLPGEDGRKPCNGSDLNYAVDPHFKDLCLFYEYFHGDNGRGCGASHQAGWTALIVELLENCSERHSRF